MGRMKYGTPEGGEVVTQPQTVATPVQEEKEIKQEKEEATTQSASA